MNGIGKYIRHIIAGLVGWAAAWAGERFGVFVDPETQAAIVVIVYAVVEKALKRFRWLDAEGWAEREWAKEASTSTAHASTEVASERIRTALLLALLLVPAAVSAQTVDTLDVEVMPALERVIIEGPITLTMGDTATYRWYGLSTTGDTMVVHGTLVAMGQALAVLPSDDPTSGRAVGVAVGSARLTVGQIRVAAMEPESVRLGYLTDAGGFAWAPGDGLSLEAGETVQMCAVVYYADGSVGVGNTDGCLTAYNARHEPTGTLAFVRFAGP